MERRILDLFFFMFCITSLATAGVTGKIAGKITDAKTGDALVGVNVIIEGTAMGAATDLEGDYFILNVPPGTYTVMASMVGFETVRITGVLVNADRTITVNCSMNTTAIELAGVTVVAKRQDVRQDVSSSQVTATSVQVIETPLVQDFDDYIQLQAGVEGELIRGGSRDQVGLVVDGLTMVDNVYNKPINIVNLSAIEEVTLIKGGFQAEYGNIRSGMINVVTKEGKKNYRGGVDYRYTLPALKHRGYSIFDHRNFSLRPYLDPDVCWVGTKNGNWNTYAQQQYPEFEGWNVYAARLNNDDDPSNDMTPEQCRDLFIWQHRADGSDALGHPHPGKYGEKPDQNLDVSFGGPVPVIGKYLGDMTFFASVRDNVTQTTFPSARENKHIRNLQIKLNSRISSSMKLGIESMIGRSELPGEEGGYFPHGGTPMDVEQSVLGVTLDHVLSSRTSYNVRFSMVSLKNDQYGARTLRDTTKIRQFGNIWVDEQPWGWIPVSGYQRSVGDAVVLGGVGAGERNFTKITTYNLKFNFISQINKYNEIKTGFDLVCDDIDVWEGVEDLDPTDNYLIDWEQSPIRVGAYVQDKLEFEGVIANVGLRLDWNNPNTEWYTTDPYSKYFSRIFKNLLEKEAPKEKAKGQLTVSPRIGISHPISDVSKLFFSYGHFYSMPPSFDMYMINYGVASSGIERIGNPSLKMPRTIAYELGYEHKIANMFLLTLTGYYRDVTDEVGDVRYVNYDESVNYAIARNDHYADIRGFEVELRRSWGRWITGWFNYTYMVTTDGMIGREFQYQDPRVQAVEGKRTPVQEKPLPLPYANAMIQVRTPFEFGPKFSGLYPFERFSVNFLCHYHAGDYLTWEPKPPYKLENNLQWKDRWNFDARFVKDFAFGKNEFSLFVDIVNIFDIKYLTGGGFEDESDHRDYMNSLHLPMYSEKKYQDAGYTAGDDKVGDVWSEDKPYINMPNVDFRAWNPPRSITLGFQFNF